MKAILNDLRFKIGTSLVKKPDQRSDDIKHHRIMTKILQKY
jgi:hypothetical protein